MESSNCDWERTDTGVRCKRQGCGNKMKVPASMPLEKCRATCWALDPERKGLKDRRAKTAEMRQRYEQRDTLKRPCRYQGDKTGEKATCRGCGGKRLTYDLYACDVYGSCLPFVLEDSAHCCRICDDYYASEE